MRFALVETDGDLDNKFEQLSEFIESKDFIVIFLLKTDVLKKQLIESSMEQKFEHCVLLDMRVIICNGSADKQLAMVFTNTKTNRLIIQSANSVEDIEAVLRLQITTKNDKFTKI